MSVTWSQQLNIAQLRAVLANPGGPVVRDLLRRGIAVESQAKRFLSGDGAGHPKRVDTGRLRASVHTAVVARNGTPAVVVGTNVTYAPLVHEGTGIYGPRGQPIRPRRAKLLRFRPRGSARWVYARQVSGMRPNPFLRDALPAALH